MSFFISSGLYSFIANIVIGLFVYTRNPKKTLNILFALFSLTVSGWSVGSFLENIIPNRETALFVLRFNYLFGIWLPSVYIHFVYELTGTYTKVAKQKLRLGYCLSFLLSPAVFTPWFIPKLRLIETTQFLISVPGPLYYAFFAFFSISMLEVISHTTLRLNKYYGKQKTQIIYMTVANAIAILAGFEYFSRVFGFFKSPPLDDYILVVYFLVVAYAIVRHHLMNIEVIIKKTLVFAGLFAMVMAVVGAVTTLTQVLLVRYLPVSSTLSMTVSILLALLLYDPTRKFLIHATDRYLFQKKEDFKIVLNQLSKNIITILDIDKVGRTVLTTLRDSLRLESGAILLKDESENQFRVLEIFGVKPERQQYSKSDSFIRFFAEQESLVNLEMKDNRCPPFIEEEMKKLKAVIAIPLFIHIDLIGILLLGKKKSDQEFTPDEIDYFPTVASQVAIALSNARLYDILKKSQIDFAQQAKMASIGTLSAGISHEIKNPLNHIKVGIAMLRMNKKHGILDKLDRPQFEEEIFKTLEILDENVTRANEVIERLSSFAKKPKELKIEPIDLRKAVDLALSFLEAEFKHFDIVVKKDFPSDFPLVKADLHTVEDVFLNLFVNARHAMDRAGTLTIQGSTMNGELEVAIQDTGGGISKENLDKIFDPFFTTKDVTRNPDKNAVKGSGLGLFIVREFIQRFGGRITVDSEVGRGTAFHIYFPDSTWVKGN